MGEVEVLAALRSAPLARMDSFTWWCDPAECTSGSKCPQLCSLGSSGTEGHLSGLLLSWAGEDTSVRLGSEAWLLLVATMCPQMSYSTSLNLNSGL